MIKNVKQFYNLQTTVQLKTTQTWGTNTLKITAVETTGDYF